MPAIPAYDRDPYRTELETAVLRGGRDGDRPFAVLADTILYPEGGGQPADRGQLNGVAVLDVQKREGEIRHYLTSEVAIGPASLTLDWERRFDHMQQHTGQHLLTAVAQARLGWETTAFHLGETRCDIELATPSITPSQLEALEAAVAAEVRAGHAVAARHVSSEAYASLGVRSRGLPEGHQGDVRLVEIAGLDLNTCGGTHVRTTSELEVVSLLGVEPVRGGTRLFFVVGGRARRRLADHERRNAALRTLLGAPDEELAAAVEAKLEQVKVAERRGRLLEEELASCLAESLASDAKSLVERHFEGRDGAFLQRVVRQVLQMAPSKWVFLTATHGETTTFLLGASPDSAAEVAELGAKVATLLGTKGGGAKGLFQGKAPGLGGRPDAVALLATRA